MSQRIIPDTCKDMSLTHDLPDQVDRFICQNTECLVNEKYVQQVLEIEKQAQKIAQNAVHQAEQLPIQAKREAEALVEQARTEARAEADQLVGQAEAKAESERILIEAEASAERMEALAMTHFDRAVTFVLNRLVGRE